MPGQTNKRKLLRLALALPWISGSFDDANGSEEDPQRRFRKIRITLVVDAVSGAKMQGVSLVDDRSIEFYTKAVVARRNREIMSLGGSYVPLTVRATWRDKPKPIWNSMGGISYEGPILGDYKIPVASRIPQSVLDSIHRDRGGLRLKFRLKPDGVLFGWDIERARGGTTLYSVMPGGDFLETDY